MGSAFQIDERPVDRGENRPLRRVHPPMESICERRRESNHLGRMAQGDGFEHGNLNMGVDQANAHGWRCRDHGSPAAIEAHPLTHHRCHSPLSDPSGGGFFVGWGLEQGR